MPTHKKRGFTLIELLVVIAIIALLMSILMPALGQAREQARRVVCLTNLNNMGNAVSMYAGDYREFIVPFEYRQESGARSSDNWAALFIRDNYLSAPLGDDKQDLPQQNTPFKCPSGVMSTWEDMPMPQSHTDARGAVATSSEVSDESWDDVRGYVHTWYGGNAATYYTEYFPLARVPDDDGDWDVMKRLGEIRRPSDLVAFYDGLWAHNCGSSSPDGAYRINARHMNATETNMLLFDGSAHTINKDDLPSGGRLEQKSTYDNEHPWPLFPIKWAKE